MAAKDKENIVPLITSEPFIEIGPSTRRTRTQGRRPVRPHRRRRSRMGSLVGGEENPFIIYYPPAELERQRRLEDAINHAVYVSGESHNRYIPPEEEGIREYMEGHRARIYRLRRRG